MRHSRIGRGPCSLLVVGAMALSGGCPFQSRSDSGRDAPRFPATGIVVKVVNATDQPLDPQLYAGSTTGDPEGLFEPANRRTDFGVGHLGILLPGGEGLFAVTCEQHVLIGTLGGVFGEDLTAPQGQGDRLVLEEGLNVSCGDLVTFTFREDGNRLRVSLAIGPRDD